MTTSEIYQRNGALMRSPIGVKESYSGGKSIEQYYEIPEGVKGVSPNEQGHTHVKLVTRKWKNGVICSSYGVKVAQGVGGFGSVTHLLFGSDKYKADLCVEGGRRATDKALLDVHRGGVASLRSRFPELFEEVDQARRPEVVGDALPLADRIDATIAEDESAERAPEPRRVIIASSRLQDMGHMQFIYDTQNGQWDAMDEANTAHMRYDAGEDDLIRAKENADQVAPMLTDITLSVWEEPAEDEPIPTTRKEPDACANDGDDDDGDENGRFVVDAKRQVGLSVVD